MAEQVVGTVIKKVLDLLFSAIKREIDYIRKCTENVSKLRNEAEKLERMKGRVQQQINKVNDEGDDLVHGVQEWVDRAKKEISMVEKFLEEEANDMKTCFNLRLCINLGTLSRYSKTAMNNVLALQKLHEDGQTYESGLAIPARTPGVIELYQKKNLNDFNTQKLSLGQIIEAINDESIQIIGIYGLGGVGKTTLAKEVAVAVKDLFVDVVFITISQTVDAEKIQKLVKGAANQIMKEKKILIILDDLWAKLDLVEMGIPCGIDHKNCKILLTSRSIDVCVAMDAQSKICVNPLPEEEAWNLFKNMAGEIVESDIELKPIATKVAKECGGLPLIIQVVGKALQNKSIDVWEAALDRLENHYPLDIDPEIRKAFIRLELSYNFLESEVAKSCFLLCSTFPEDSHIPLESLTHYMVCLRKFERLRSIDDAKKRVLIAVTTLKSSFLLLDDDEESSVIMHDVVRDVALLIASKGQNNFLVDAGNGLKEWRIERDDALKRYTTISLMCNFIPKVPDHELGCQHLDTLLL